MMRPSISDVLFLIMAVIVLLLFSAFDANFSTYFFFLLFVAAMWTAKRAKREARLKTAALSAELENERRARVDEIEALRKSVRELQAAKTIMGSDPETVETAEGRSAAASVAGKVAQPAVKPAAAPAMSEKAAPLAATPKIEAPFYPQFGTVSESRDWGTTLRRLLDFEQMFGTNWLSKLGIAILVFGIAFFLAWQLRELGPAGKIVVGVTLSGILLGAGIWGERHEHYRTLGRASLAGGWPLLFFVAYAANHVPAARIITSPLAGLVLMFIVVAAMVGHTLRFRSQVVTGLAFVLAFSTVALNRVDVYSLSANVILAIGLSFVALRMQWYELEIFGILAAYVNHFIWLMPIIEPMHGKVHPFPQFLASAAILLMYWTVFRVSYVVRPPLDERRSAFAGVLNTALLLAVLKYQAAHPEWAFWALLCLGAVELALGQVTKARGKRISFAVLSTLGVALVGAAIPFRYAADHVSPIWLVEAELFFALGMVTDERVFRRLGSLAALATASHLFAVDAARVYGARLDGSYVVHEGVLGAIFFAAMLALYADADWAPQQWPEHFENEIDLRIAKYLSYAAAITGALGAWVMFPAYGAAVGWMALAVVLAWSGTRFSISHLITQANLLALIAVLRCLLVNLPSSDIATRTPFAISYRLLSVGAVAALGYALSRWNRSSVNAIAERMPHATTWAASLLVMLVAWYELAPASVVLGWAIFGLIALEAGTSRDSRNLRAQAYVALLAAFFRVFIVNLNAEQLGAKVGPKIYTVFPVVLALLYAHERLHKTKRKMSSLFAWCGVLAAAAMLRFEVQPDVVATAWAGSVLVLIAIAYYSQRRVFLHIGLTVAFAAVFRGVLHNLYERSYFPWPGKFDPWLLVGGATALLLASLPFAFRLKLHPVTQNVALWKRAALWLDARPEQALFFLPLVLFTLLLESEMRKGALTMAWGVEAVVVFLFALWVKERSYRLAGLFLLLLCVGKIFVVDFWSLTIRDKALTGITVGLALIGVSVLYTRKREKIKHFL